MYKIRLTGLLMFKLVTKVNVPCRDNQKQKDIYTQEQCRVDITWGISFAKLSKQHINTQEDQVSNTKEVEKRNFYMFTKTDHFKRFDPPHADQGCQCVLKN